MTTSIKQLVFCDLNFNFPSLHFILIKPVLSDHLSYVMYCNVPLEGHISQV